MNITDNRKTLKLSSELRNLYRMKDLPIIIPLESSLLAPELRGSDTQKPSICLNPFPEDLPTIQGFGEDVQVMNSLQKPKVITFIGTDGNRYKFLCKPNDDLRKDHRMMEVFGLLNRLLKKNADGRKGNLSTPFSF